MDEMAREHAARAIEVLADVMDSDMEESRDRIRAAEAILDRGYGKAAQAIIQVPASKQQEAILAALSDEDLIAIIEQKKLPSLFPKQALVVVESMEKSPIPTMQHIHGPALDIYAGAPASADAPTDPLLL